MLFQLNNMPTSSRFPFVALLLMITFTINGCAGIDATRIAPNPQAQPTSKVGSSLRVMDVTGGKKSHFGGAEMIGDTQFKEAILLALQQSGLFNVVSSERGDVSLYAEIRAQDQKVSRGLQYTATMVVTYKFTDSAGATIWSATYDSEFSSTAISGGTRTRKAREGAARENLSSLVRGIREQWPVNR
jgi:hypothetical protein